MNYKKKFNSHYYLNKDLNWLDFNSRVLHESIDPRVPLLERLLFIDIFRSNNDEFFMKRIGSLYNKPPNNKKGTDRVKLRKELKQKVILQLDSLAENYNNSLLPTLEKEGIYLTSWENLRPEDKVNLKDYFKDQIYPILTPLAVDHGHPFPFLSNLSKSIGLTMKSEGSAKIFFARVKIPSEINQWKKLTPTDTALRFINIDSIIQANLQDLFPGMNIISSFIFRVTRNAAISGEDDDAEDKMGFVEEGLRERKFAPVVRLEFQCHADKSYIEHLKQELNLDDESLYELKCLANYTNLAQVYKYGGKEGKYLHLIPNTKGLGQFKSSNDFFEAIKKQDYLLHFPFDSFNSSVEAMVNFAAIDSKVQGIKIVLYRTDTDGKIINALIEAAENKIQVACIIELTARFDEERNIRWAQKLEDAGVHVSYGLMEYKTHAKMISVVRKEDDGIFTYINIGTGNYNSQTSKVYTDLGYFTCQKEISREILEVFNFLTGRSEKIKFEKLIVAPFSMYEHFIHAINNEVTYAEQGNPGEIIAKMNQLEDPGIIDALYLASQAGVKVTLYVRGFCCLIPGVDGVSDNITVYSLVGRFLEHSRIYYFSKGNQSNYLNGDYYIGSADWMGRNLHNRVEVITPITPNHLKEYLWNYLNLYKKDNRHIWELKNDGHYYQRNAIPPIFNIQEEMIKMHRSSLSHFNK